MAPEESRARYLRTMYMACSGAVSTQAAGDGCRGRSMPFKVHGRAMPLGAGYTLAGGLPPSFARPNWALHAG